MSHALLAQTIPLWPEKPPQYLADASTDTTDERGTARNVTAPSLVLLPAPPERRTGIAIIDCAGDRYGGLDWRTHKATPPVHLVHATNDGFPGGALIELPQQIKANPTALGVPVKMDEFAEDAHGVGNLIPQRIAHGFPPARWPQLLLKWLEQIRTEPR